MAYGTLTVNVQARIPWYRWLGWQVLRLWLLASVALGLRSADGAYHDGADYLIGSLSYRVDCGPWRKLS